MWWVLSQGPGLQPRGKRAMIWPSRHPFGSACPIASPQHVSIYALLPSGSPTVCFSVQEVLCLRHLCVIHVSRMNEIEAWGLNGLPKITNLELGVPTPSPPASPAFLCMSEAPFSLTPYVWLKPSLGQSMGLKPNNQSKNALMTLAPLLSSMRWVLGEHF